MSTQSENISDKYRLDDCAIVSMGCCLPDANNVETFWQNLIKNHNSIDAISQTRWDKDHNYSPYRELDDKSYSYYGAEIEQNIFDQLQEIYSPKAHASKLDLMTLSAVEQALSQIKITASPEKIGAVLGAMNPDENYFIIRFLSHLQTVKDKLKKQYVGVDFAPIDKLMMKHCQAFFKNVPMNLDDILPGSVLAKLKKKFQFSGRSYLVDAACASGMASIDAAVSLLKTGKLDLVIAGGIESNLGQGAFVLFSKVGALAVEKGLPFDKRSDGISQGEGAVILCLQRLGDALRDGHKIHGIIKSIGSSSDGRVTSLFQPSSEGQMFALKRAYDALSSKRVDYLELHGTGTKIGDLTEAQATENFFKGFQIPVGSVKSLIGHTKATAGAAGLLKCVLAMENGTLPSSDYIQESVFPAKSDLYINDRALKLPLDENGLRCGVSSFGFGGTNFHVVVDHKPGIELTVKNLSSAESSEKQKNKFKPVLLGHKTISYSDFDPQWFTGKSAFYKLPPKSIRYIDKAQLLAVRACEQLLFNDLGLKLTQAQADEVRVFSASSLGLDVLDDIIYRISIDTMGMILQGKAKESDVNESETLKLLSQRLFALKDDYVPAAEDSAPGILNNVIAGRVSNAFNFHGKNLNIDCNQASVAAAMELICAEISLGVPSLYILLGVNEKVNPQDFRVIRDSVTAYAICSDHFAKENMLAIQSVIEVQ